MSRRCPGCQAGLIPVEIWGSEVDVVDGKIVHLSAWSVECPECGYLCMDIESETPEGALKDWDEKEGAE